MPFIENKTYDLKCTKRTIEANRITLDVLDVFTYVVFMLYALAFLLRLCFLIHFGSLYHKSLSIGSCVVLCSPYRSVAPLTVTPFGNLVSERKL